MTNTISELLAYAKTKEAELLKYIDLRDEIIKREFKLKSWELEKGDPKKLEKKEEEFFADKKKRVVDLTKKIADLKKDLIETKHNINEKNIKLELDKKILNIKFLRIELSKLDKIAKADDYYGGSLNSDILKELGIIDIIEKLEEEKRKVDLEIQKINHSEVL